MNLLNWEWKNRIVQNGSPAMWQSSTGDDGCSTWTVRTLCISGTAGAPDQAFSLQGTAEALPTPTPAPTPKKKCKKHKKKHKPSASSAKKKCKKKRR